MSQPPPPPPNQPPPPPGQPPQGYGYPQQPQQPPQGGGYGYPQQPQQPPQGGGTHGAPTQAGPYGPPQPPQGQPPQGQPQWGQPPQGQPPYGQPPQGQPPYGQPPYGQPPYGPGGPGGYPGMPPGGGSGGGNGKVIAIVAAALAVVLAVGVGGWAVLSGDDSGGNQAGSAGGADKPANPAGKELFKTKIPAVSGDTSVQVPGAWSDGKMFAQSDPKGVRVYDANSGSEKHNIPLPGEVCGASRDMTKDHKVAVVFASSSSEDADCNRFGVLDLDGGKKLWDTDIPGSEDTISGTVDVALSQNVAAVSWTGGSAAFEVKDSKPKKPLWHSDDYDGDCRDDGFSGGKELTAVVACEGDDLDDDQFKMQKLNPRTGKQQWEAKLPEGVKGVKVVSADPMVVAVGAGSSTPTDLMVIGKNKQLKTKIPIGDDDYDTGCSTGTESCSKIVADKSFVYLKTRRHPGDDEVEQTSEVLAFSLSDGKNKWKTDGGSDREMAPIRTAGGKLVAYVQPTFDQGGKVVAVDPKTRKKETYLKNPAGSAKIERNLTSVNDERPLFEGGKLFLRTGRVSKPLGLSDDSDKYSAIGFGAK